MGWRIGVLLGYLDPSQAPSATMQQFMADHQARVAAEQQHQEMAQLRRERPEIHQHINSWSRNKEHFGVVQRTMGELLAAGRGRLDASGRPDLDHCYQQACILHNLPIAAPKPVSKASTTRRHARAPTRGRSVKDTIQASLRELSA